MLDQRDRRHALPLLMLDASQPLSSETDGDEECGFVFSKVFLVDAGRAGALDGTTG